MANTYRFEASGHVDVDAETPEAAREMLKTRYHNLDRVFCINEDDGKVFAIVIPSSNAPTVVRRP